MRILLLEPDAVLARTLTAALERAGHRVIVSTTAQAAIQAADTGPLDAVILELQLVSHSGIEFLYEFRSYHDWQGVPVIIHSLVPPSEFNDNQRLLQKTLGVTTYLYKPQTSLARLTAALNELASVTA